MTPLAHRIVREMTLPVKRRTFNNAAALLPHRMSDLHCFDVTAVVPLIDMLSIKNSERSELDERSSFLPAPRTWIECATGNGARLGYWLEAIPGQPRATVISAFLDDGHDLFGCVDNGHLTLGTLNQPQYDSYYRDVSPSVLLAMLAIINTPRIIGRLQHMPHRGLEQKLLANQKLIGKVPLHAWTEIKLNVNPTQDASAEPSTEAHLTGEKALHFCRAHLRVRFGRLEIVSSHWRGNPALGIKQSRYKLVA